jgi:site-specific recombinase XerD
MFDEYLQRTRGLAAGTRGEYCDVVARFLAAFCGSSSVPDWSQLRSKHLSIFVRHEASRWKRNACKVPAVAIRAFLRYLTFIGVIKAGLEDSIPKTPRWRYEALPRSLSSVETQRVVDSIPTHGRTGLRDRAIILLLARMGLRAVEVSRLTLDDIDWSTAIIWLRQTKGRKERCLPLPQDARRALHEYIERGRQQCASRTVFLRTLSPAVPLRNSAAICKIARRALTRAGITDTPAAAHLFRHAAATGMLAGGASFKEIADVLGHACLKTTATYAKLDLTALSAISMPWPGAKP